MTSSAAFGDLLEYNIGGGWGLESLQLTSPDAAYVIRGTDIPRALTGDISSVPLRYHSASNLRSRALQVDDIVFEVSGGSKGQPVGRALLVTERLLGRFDQPVMCASFCKLMRINGSGADPRFVYRVLQAAYADGRLDAFQVQSTGITNFKWKPFLEHFQVRLPPRSAQKLVTEVLDVLDALIENNRRRVEVLEEMARTTYREWFVHFRYPGHESTTLIESELGPIPGGWGVGRVDSHFVLQRGFDLPAKERQDGPVPIIGASGRQGFHSTAKAIGPGLTTGRSGTVGVVTYVPSDYWPLNTSLWVKEFRLSTPRSAYFLLSSLDLVAAASGAAVPTLNRNVVHALPAVCPPRGLIEEWDIAALPIFDSMELLRLQSERLVGLRDLLLPRLVTGQIDVSSLDLDALEEDSVA